METDFANIAGMFKTNTDLVNKTINEVNPESWFLQPGDQSNHFMWVVFAIEKLHQQDIAATISGDPNKLAELWADDAVRLGPGPAEVGKKLITQHDAETMQKNGEMRILTYTPEIRDIKIADGWAFEWGYFNSTYRETSDAPVKSLRGKLLRVLERQKDGSWKFARVMWNPTDDI